MIQCGGSLILFRCINLSLFIDSYWVLLWFYANRFRKFASAHKFFFCQFFLRKKQQSKDIINESMDTQRGGYGWWVLLFMIIPCFTPNIRDHKRTVRWRSTWKLSSWNEMHLHSINKRFHSNILFHALHAFVAEWFLLCRKVKCLKGTRHILTYFINRRQVDNPTVN